ncbi:MAG: hypothetical protein LBS21_14260 [Clostridiales bacterium]|jgi:hypothetical protein|nr:hypothetical protein [Clostridiales bacterium]
MNESVFSLIYDLSWFIIMLVPPILTLTALFLSIKTYVTFKKNTRYHKEYLEKAGFIISRSYGKSVSLKDILNKHNSYTVFFDDTNRKWAFATPTLKKVSKIRDYSDLIDYRFFDEDGKSIYAGGFTIPKVAACAVLVIAKFINSPANTETLTQTGSMILLMAAVLLVHNMILSAKGVSRKFGLKIKTKDSNELSPYIVLDYISILKHPSKVSKFTDCELGSVPLELGYLLKTKGKGRASDFYKINREAINKIETSFYAIITQNAETVL